MKLILTLLVATLFSFANLSYANTTPRYPDHITYEKTKVSFWCQREDIKVGDCDVVSMTPDEEWVSVTGTPGTACEDTPIGIVNMRTGKARDIDYDGGCKTQTRPQFVRMADGKIGLQVVDVKANWAITTVPLN